MIPHPPSDQYLADPDASIPSNADILAPPSNPQRPPRLPPSLVPTILTLILPYSGCLPPDLLSKPFQQRLIFLPPGEDEMDKQLSPFPLPVSVHALMERLEALAREHTLGKERYGWDGEAYVAKRALLPEGAQLEAGAELQRADGAQTQGVELHFMHEQERGWTFHGLRIPEGDEAKHETGHDEASGSGFETDTPSSGLGMIWSDDPSDVSAPDSAYSSNISRSPDAGLSHFDGSIPGQASDPYGSLGALANPGAGGGEEDEDEHASETKRQAAASAFWSAWSPESKSAELPQVADQQREEDYWAQYSAGPSVAPSAVQSVAHSPALPSRKLSERQPGREGQPGTDHGTAGDAVGHAAAQAPRVFDAAGGGAGLGYPFPSPSTLDSVYGDAPTPLAGPGDSTSSSLGATAPADPVNSIRLDSPPLSPPRYVAAPTASNDAALLRTRLNSKITSLLRRAWHAFTLGVERQDELEVRGMRWLEIGRSVCLSPGTPTGFGSGTAAGVGTGAGWYAQPTSSDTNGAAGEDEVRARVETMYEMFDVAFDDDNDDDDGIDGAAAGGQSAGNGRETESREQRAGAAFYRLVEQAVRPANGASGVEGGETPGLSVPAGGEALGRRYSSEQLSYWE